MPAKHGVGQVVGGLYYWQRYAKRIGVADESLLKAYALYVAGVKIRAVLQWLGVNKRIGDKVRVNECFIDIDHWLMMQSDGPKQGGKVTFAPEIKNIQAVEEAAQALRARIPAPARIYEGRDT